MGFAFRIMIFLLAFNLAVGATAYIFGASGWLVGLDQNIGLSQTDQLYSGYAENAGVPVEETSFWYRFLDVISLGFFNKIKLFMDTTLFSVPNLLIRLRILSEGLMGYVYAIMSIIFVLGTFELFTGKDLTQR